MAGTKMAAPKRRSDHIDGGRRRDLNLRPRAYESSRNRPAGSGHVLPRLISFVTCAGRSFYRGGLGLLTEGIVERECKYRAVAFFTLRNGVLVAPWPRTSIARDSGISVQPPSAADIAIAPPQDAASSCHAPGVGIGPG